MIEYKLTYSDIIATLAFICSIISVWYAFKTRQDSFSNITIDEKLPAGGSFFSQDDNKWKYFLCYEFSCTNHGGRKSSLLSIEQFNEEPSSLTKKIAKLLKYEASTFRFLMGEKKNGKTINLNIDYSIFQMKEKINDVENITSKIFDSYYKQGSKELIYINQSIEPGVTEILTLGIIFDLYEIGPKKLVKNDLEAIYIAFRLMFNNKQEHVFRRAILKF